MQTIPLKSWAEFRPQIERIRNEHGRFQMGNYDRKNTILFRGQPKADDPLKTTLERYSRKAEWTMESYARLSHSCLPEIESFTGKEWGLGEWRKMEKLVRNNQDADEAIIPRALYSYWVYLRHHGFPSPLLDWTLSPFIAAFFAFENADKIGKEAAVYAYIEMPGGTKTVFEAQSRIEVYGPYVTTHTRHFLQQSWYTVATQLAGRTRRFVCHENIFKGSGSNQDLLIKLVLPRSARAEALAYLAEHNITHFSLMQSEEALMQTLAYEHVQPQENHGDQAAP